MQSQVIPRLLSMLGGFVLAAADFPPLALPQGVGVNIHFNRGHAADLDLIAGAGFKWVRMDLGWAGIERERGRYEWSAYDELTANLEKRGLRAIYILDYSNPLYEDSVVSRDPVFGKEQKDTAAPQKPESVAAFAHWAGEAARHFQGRRVIWEIWNEPNIAFWKPKPDVKQYNALALATCLAIRAADPAATIIGPATSEVPLQFIEEFFASGILAHLDGVSVHPYRSYSRFPETAAEDYTRLRDLIRRYAPAGRKELPIISGEWGYASHAKGVSLEAQAAFIVRQQLANLLAGVPISIWYDWKNDGTDAAEREHNFGTVWPDLKPKPAYTAVQVMTAALGGFHIVRRLDAGDLKAFVLLLDDDHGHEKLAAWTTGEPREAEIAVRVKPRAQLKAVHGLGEISFGLQLESLSSGSDGISAHAQSDSHASLRFTKDRLAIGLGPMPLYVSLDGVAVTSPAAKP